MADSPSGAKVEFQIRLWLPEGSGPPRLQELILPEPERQELFRRFNIQIKQGKGFLTELGVARDFRPVTVRFTHVGKTAAFFMLSHDVRNEPQHIHGLVALLTRMDSSKDAEAIGHVRRYAVLRAINPAAFDGALKGDCPLAAAFFADAGSASNPPVHTILCILSAAFFQQFTIDPRHAN